MDPIINIDLVNLQKSFILFKSWVKNKTTIGILVTDLKWVNLI